MASDYTLIGLRWRHGEYSVAGSEIFNTIKEVDWSGLRSAHPLKDVAPDVGYADEMTVITPVDLAKFIRGENAQAFYDRMMAENVFVFLVHRAEWESGLSD